MVWQVENQPQGKMNLLIEQFKKYGNITSNLEEELERKVKFLKKNKGDFWLKEGQIVSSLFIIEKGLVRSFYNTNKGEINVWFGFENVILGSIMPLFFKRTSIENIQFLEDSTVYYISSNDLKEFYKSSHEMNKIGRKLAEEYCQVLEERSFSLQTQSAEQRYKNLLKNQPEAIHRISLGHIASYLGISRETLSRIRKK